MCLHCPPRPEVKKWLPRPFTCALEYTVAPALSTVVFWKAGLCGQERPFSFPERSVGSVGVKSWVLVFGFPPESVGQLVLSAWTCGQCSPFLSHLGQVLVVLVHLFMASSAGGGTQPAPCSRRDSGLVQGFSIHGCLSLAFQTVRQGLLPACLGGSSVCKQAVPSVIKAIKAEGKWPPARAGPVSGT